MPQPVILINLQNKINIGRLDILISDLDAQFNKIEEKIKAYVIQLSSLT